MTADVSRAASGRGQRQGASARAGCRRNGLSGVSGRIALRILVHPTRPAAAKARTDSPLPAPDLPPDGAIPALPGLVSALVATFWTHRRRVSRQLATSHRPNERRADNRTLYDNGIIGGTPQPRKPGTPETTTTDAAHTYVCDHSPPNCFFFQHFLLNGKRASDHSFTLFSEV
jgi:hypothetical protein